MERRLIVFLMLFVLLLCTPAFAKKTLLELGMKPNDTSAAADNSRLLNEALIARKGGSYQATPGTWYFAKPIQVPAGYAARFWSHENGQWRYNSEDLVKFKPAKEFPSKRYLIEFGGPGAPNGTFRQHARDCTVERIGFDCDGRGDVGGIALYQCEQGRIISCQFHGCWRAVQIESKDLRWNMNHLVQSCQFGLCKRGISIMGEGKGQTFGGVVLQSLIIQKCTVGIFQHNVNVPTYICGVHVQNSKESGLYFKNAKATLTSSYFENFFGAVDYRLQNASSLFCVGWNRGSSWKRDHTSDMLGNTPER